MKRFLKITTATAMLLALAPAVAKADLSAMDWRRTLFAPAGQRMLILEAPIGMCFLNTSMYEEGAMFGQMQDMVKGTTGGQVLGIFAPCMDAANIPALMAGGGGDTRITGTVIWLNAFEGGETKMALSDYLDMQEVKYPAALADKLGGKAIADAPVAPVEKAPLPAPEKKDDAKKDGGLEAALQEIENGGGVMDNAPMEPSVNSQNLAPVYNAFQLPTPGEYVFDGHARRTASGVTVDFTAEMNRDYVRRSTTGISGTTLLNRVPVEVRLAYTQKEPYDREELEKLMDKFLEQQTVLNK